MSVNTVGATTKKGKTMKPIDTIALSENYRYARYHDDYFDYLREYDHVFSIYAMDYPGRLGRIELDTYGANADLAEMLNYRGFNDESDDNETAARKHLARRGYSCEFLELRGYSQREWQDVVAYWPDTMDLSGQWDELRAWFRGDVFSIHLEELVPYYGYNGRHLEQWETVDAISCVIFTDNYEFTKENCAELVGEPERTAA